MILLATTLLLAGSLAVSDPASLLTNSMLREAAVNHDLAKVKRQFERTLPGNSGPGRQTSTSAPTIAR